MDQLFDRISNLFKSFFNDLDDDYDSGKTGSNEFYDPDMQDAWDELNDFLNDEEPSEKTRSSTGGSNYKSYTNTGASSGPDPMLKKDFENLNVPFGASYEEVKKSYKNLLRKYHPDKHAQDPEKMKHATQIAQKINESFLRIKQYYKKK